MKFKITYEKDRQQHKVLVEAASLNQAMRLGFHQYQWEMVLEITDEQNQRVANV